MKNFGKIYFAIKEIETQTLFNYYKQDEKEYVFRCEIGAFTQYAHIGLDDVYFTSSNKHTSILLSKKELELFVNFMNILKKVN